MRIFGFLAILLSCHLSPGGAAEEPKPLATFETPGGALSISKDNQLVAIGADYQGPLKIFSLARKEETAELESIKGVYLSVSLSPDAKLLAVVRVTTDPPENNLSVWDVRAKRRLWETKEGTLWASFSPDGKAVAAGKHIQIRFFHPRTGAVLEDFPAHPEATVVFIEYARNGKTLVTAGDDDRQVKAWNVAKGTSQRSFQLEGNEVTALAVSDDGALVSAAQGTKVSVYDVKSGQRKWAKTPHEEQVRALSFRPKSVQLVSGSQDGSVCIWNGATGTQVTQFRPERGVVQAASYSASGELLLIGTSGATLVYPADFGGSEQEFRTWRSSTAKFRVEAKFVAAEDDQVILVRKADQKEIRVALSQLDASDRELVGKLKSAVSTPNGTQQTLKYVATDFEWKPGAEAIPLISAKKGIAMLAGVSGNFGGYGQNVAVALGADDLWRLDGRAPDSHVVAKAITLSQLEPQLFDDTAEEFTWSVGQMPVKMLKREEGVCFLSGVSGAFRGYGEEARVRLAEDGFWYLQGTSGQQELSAKAVALRWKDAEAISAEISEQVWDASRAPIELLAANQGICFLGSLSGHFAGGGEIVRLSLQDGIWHLGGQSGQDALSARALVVRIKAKR